MGWKDKLTKSPPDSAQNALERIRAASATQDGESRSKFDDFDDELLEVFAATEEVLCPAAEAGTLGPAGEGAWVRGVHDYYTQYKGAGEAWKERITNRRLLTGQIADDGSYRLNKADVQRISDYIVNNIDSLLRSALDKDFSIMEQKQSRKNQFTNELKNNRQAMVWLDNPEYVAQLKEIAADAAAYMRERSVVFKDFECLEQVGRMLLAFRLEFDSGIMNHHFRTRQENWGPGGQEGHIYNYKILGQNVVENTEFTERALQPIQEQIAADITALATPKTIGLS